MRKECNEAFPQLENFLQAPMATSKNIGRRFRSKFFQSTFSYFVLLFLHAKFRPWIDLADRSPYLRTSTPPCRQASLAGAEAAEIFDVIKRPTLTQVAFTMVHNVAYVCTCMY